MPIIDVTSDPERLTLTVVGEYPVPLERLWEAWADPRQVERFWGPPGYPATFTRHDMAVGGESHYFMTGPDGGRSAGFWRFEAVEPGRSFEVVDGFAHDDGTANDEMPTMRMRFQFERTEDGSRFRAVTTFPNQAAMEQLVEMGMVEGTRLAMGQLADLLDDLQAFTAGRGTTTDLLDDRRARVSRLIRGGVDAVWRAHHDPALVQRWLLGPDGWTMPVCEVATRVGDSFRYEWERVGGGDRFGFEGELLASSPPTRSVTTERMLGTDGPTTTNEMTLTAIGDTTLLSIVVTYPSRELRDQILATGMTDGMERSYQRLEDEVLVPTG